LNAKEMAELHGSLREGGGDSGREEEDEDEEEEEEEEVQEAAEVEEEVEEEEEEEGQHQQHGGEMEGEEAAAAEGDEDDEYELRFEGEMDPLRFAEEDETGKLPYEQFQRLEYEALAARKRKKLASRRE
jgi:general transcription factor 3C polypeptide 3 (transcription factor C subunit 4)